ncbi:MAG: DinB family protein [Bacteroidia bacterium]
MKDIVETWNINNRINLYLLDSIAENNLGAVSASKGRNVGEQFAHLHNVRLMWLKVADPDLLKELTKVDKEAKISKKLLAAELEKSAKAVATLLEKGFKENKIKGFKPHPSAFLGYLISHESHHRGQVMLALKQSGYPVDQKTQYGIWEWGVR